MESNNIITAPQLDSISYFYEIWSRSHVGSYDDFICFMTTPGAERDAFLSSIAQTHASLEFKRGVASLTFRQQQ